ncbi:hypothetical protein L3Q82_000747 [Scortum barcoo]|uniref:Uncharacterized protein n=1 Tax=Scortum barcoo TaxID=214431 RepID=A0ACB8WEP9_9TELE|nr:hypothetical protein L3Q82_000747 [Scortum barcoo]
MYRILLGFISPKWNTVLYECRTYEEDIDQTTLNNNQQVVLVAIWASVGEGRRSQLEPSCVLSKRKRSEHPVLRRMKSWEEDKEEDEEEEEEDDMSIFRLNRSYQKASRGSGKGMKYTRTTGITRRTSIGHYRQPPPAKQGGDYTSSPLLVQLQIIRAPVGSNVLVACPELPGREMTFSLYRDDEMIYNCSRSHEKNGTRCKPPYTRVGVEVHENATSESVHFRLTGVNASSLGVYRCESVVTFPPPFKTKTSDLETLVLVEGPKCPENKDCSSKTEGVQNIYLLWWIPVSVLIIYSIIATIVAVIYRKKLRNADLQNDYINTKPSAPRNRGKKRGVTNPIPRHF